MARPNPPTLVKVDGILLAPAIVPFYHAVKDYARRIGASWHPTSGWRSRSLKDALRDAWEVGKDVAGKPGWRETVRGLIFRPARYSYHDDGLAWDVESDQLAALGRFAEGLGMRWGGRFGDPVHFDLGRNQSRAG